MRPSSAIACLALAAALACSDEQPTMAAPVPAAESEVDTYRARVAANPADADAWFHLAEVFERGGMYEEEADALRKVVALQPDMGWAIVKLGTTYNRLGKWREAVETFERARPRAGEQPVLYNNLALSYGKLGRTADQIAALRKAIALRPRYAAARVNLGMALLGRGDRAGALVQVRALEAFDQGAADFLTKAIAAGRGGAR